MEKIKSSRNVFIAVLVSIVLAMSGLGSAFAFGVENNSADSLPTPNQKLLDMINDGYMSNLSYNYGKQAGSISTLKLLYDAGYLQENLSQAWNGENNETIISNVIEDLIPISYENRLPGDIVVCYNQYRGGYNQISVLVSVNEDQIIFEENDFGSYESFPVIRKHTLGENYPCEFYRINEPSQTTTVDCLAHQFVKQYPIVTDYTTAEEQALSFGGVQESNMRIYTFSDGSKVSPTDWGEWWIWEPSDEKGSTNKECSEPQVISTKPSSSVAFTLNFKATGIQSTGFSDYKEAFAALNN